MQVDQALRVLSQLQGVAPPATAARLGDIIGLIRDLNQTVYLPQALESIKPSLALVRSQADSLRGGSAGRITTEMADCLKLIYEHAASGLTMIETLELMALLRENAIKPEPLVFSGVDLLADAWQRRYLEAELRDHHVNIHADLPLPPVSGDYRMILGIVADLLDNAIRYTPYGGTIRLTAELLGSHVLFSIADNGIGLSAEDSEQVGQPFWRAVHQPLVRQYPGAGLRLHLARQLLALHSTELLFTGEPGMGSTFSFMLPVEEGTTI